MLPPRLPTTFLQTPFPSDFSKAGPLNTHFKRTPPHASQQKQAQTVYARVSMGHAYICGNFSEDGILPSRHKSIREQLRHFGHLEVRPQILLLRYKRSKKTPRTCAVRPVKTWHASKLSQPQQTANLRAAQYSEPHGFHFPSAGYVSI